MKSWKLYGRCLQLDLLVCWSSWFPDVDKASRKFLCTHLLETVHSIFHKSCVELLHSTVFHNNKEIKMTFWQGMLPSVHPGGRYLLNSGALLTLQRFLVGAGSVRETLTIPSLLNLPWSPGKSHRGTELRHSWGKFMQNMADDADGVHYQFQLLVSARARLVHSCKIKLY